ncbi:MAG: nitrilase family protein [Bacteroidales bacterium]|nr:nitrilase family protein [Bacteroidales bacterium]
MNDLRISLFQYDIAWENKAENLSRVERALSLVSGKSDLMVLPEMFSTGFSMQSDRLAETVEGETIMCLSGMARKYDIAVAGSFVAVENNRYYNRAFFITPQNEYYFYDKRHLFSMGSENKYFSAGNKPLIVHYKDWNISLMICYDLRFPVWCRNVAESFDLQLFFANWPTVRSEAWLVLLKARAIENSAYVAGVNRIGTDGNGLCYSGHSLLLDFKGTVLDDCGTGEKILTETLSFGKLRHFREKFPVSGDADTFTLQIP